MPYYCVWLVDQAATDMFWLMASTAIEARRLVALNGPAEFADESRLQCALNASKAPPAGMIQSSRGMTIPIANR